MFTPNPQARDFVNGQTVTLRSGHSISSWKGDWSGPHTFTVVSTFSSYQGDDVTLMDSDRNTVTIDLQRARVILE